MATRSTYFLLLVLGCGYWVQTEASLWQETCLGLSKLLINQTGYIQYVHYYTDIPELTGFTMHYWFNLKNNFRSATTFNYALDTKVNTDNVTLQLHQGKYLSSPSHWTLRINDILVMDVASPPVLAGEWHHMLHSWDSSQGAWSIYMDGKLLGYGYNEQARGLVIPAGGIAVSGQHQNTAFNGMDQGKGIEGWFTLFNMFSNPLLYPKSTRTLDLVARIAKQCSIDQQVEGNVISWKSTPRKGYGGIMETPAVPVCGQF